MWLEWELSSSRYHLCKNCWGTLRYLIIMLHQNKWYRNCALIVYTLQIIWLKINQCEKFLPYRLTVNLTVFAGIPSSISCKNKTPCNIHIGGHPVYDLLFSNYLIIWTYRIIKFYENFPLQINLTQWLLGT